MPQAILNMSQWATRVREVYSMARICKMSHKDIMEREQSMLYAELHRVHGAKRKVYNDYMRGYVFGLMSAERDSIMHNDLEFCYLVDGVLFSTHKETEKRKTEEFYARHAGAELNDAPSGFVWRGTVKVYSGFEPIKK